MAKWNAKRDPVPDRKDVHKFKEFLRQKYIEKRFSEDTKSDNDSSDEEEQKRRKAKKEKKERRRKQVSSSDSDEIEMPKKEQIEK